MGLPLPLAQGTLIGGHYIVGSLINSGGFGAVYYGIDTSEGNRPCAIKETYDVTPSARRQALMEASVLFTVRSQHLPEVYDAFEANARFYLVMQLIEGENLLEILRNRVGNSPIGEQEPHQRTHGPCSEQEVLDWLLPVMEILQELHSRNPAIIHRDIKPANIILTPARSAVLVDFGLIRFYDPRRNTQTMVKAVSAGFSPIEQYLARTSPQSDIYSMAATIYLLLTNRLPPAALSRSVHDDLIAPRLLNPALSPKMEHVLLKALAVNADQRYQSMSEFALALREPAFSGHSDPTVALPPLSSMPNQKQAPQHAYTGVAGQPSVPVAGSVPAQKLPHRPLLPSSVPTPATSSGGQVMVQQVSNPKTTRPLPLVSRQGCLWGVLQGTLGALLVITMRQVEYFYLSILMGFVFYVLAGLFTTRRGGLSLRGGWAGSWAGVVSTGMFWIVLFVGIVIRFLQNLQVEANGGWSSGATGRSWQAALPEFLTQITSLQERSNMNLLIALAGGLLIAFCLGWIGGMLGKSWYKTSLTKQKHP